MIRSIAISLLMQAALLGADKARSILWVAVDDGPKSTMLKNELDRNWFQPHCDVRLSPRQLNQACIVASQMTQLQRQIHGRFQVRYVECPPFVRAPAVRINHGRWETVPPQAVAYETMPLRTIDWYRARREAVMNRDMILEGCGEFWHGEGYSGTVEPELPPPWKVWKR
jgi:hypothetical protein